VTLEDFAVVIALKSVLVGKSGWTIFACGRPAISGVKDFGRIGFEPII